MVVKKTQDESKYASSDTCSASHTFPCIYRFLVYIDYLLSRKRKSAISTRSSNARNYKSLMQMGQIDSH